MKAAWIQRFWILSVVGTLAAVVCWMMASGELQRQFAANKTKIDAEFSNMQAISGKSVHGNPGVNAKEREEAKKIADSVKTLWQSLFDAQREEVLKWPDVLGADFVSYVENAKFDSAIKPLFRDRYQNYIKNRFDGLVEIVDAKKMPVDGAATFGGGFGREGGRRAEGGIGGRRPARRPDGHADRRRLSRPMARSGEPAAAAGIHRRADVAANLGDPGRSLGLRNAPPRDRQHEQRTGRHAARQHGDSRDSVAGSRRPGRDGDGPGIDDSDAGRRDGCRRRSAARRMAGGRGRWNGMPAKASTSTRCSCQAATSTPKGSRSPTPRPAWGRSSVACRSAWC